MHKQIFVNLPVRDLKRSMTFFKALGLSFNPAFTNENAACLVIGENLYAMLLTEPFFQTFTEKTLIDAHTHVETLICLSCESRAEVDDVIAKAVAAGGRTPRPPQDHGFMYGHAFEDLDGHIWELVHMAPEAA
ncbi:VOC family protein [Caballeronia grimmiae]|uniref:Extradiol dioxygenase n=1 Tax=Caballeronia grimmiae TaxID=1071679 RepID=A0A069PAN1_9BURK|nr:VOC family protein [Caballeronia grimmiae]KDR34366.1 extradiol dioxygenase [Caballeronia grimmiae]GGD51097.1 extradiol dioxygenase [Caballeronia grimmiae]